MKTRSTMLFRKDFTLVVLGQIISLFGNAVLRFALPLYLLRETGSSTLFGAVSASAFVPLILCSLLGGVLADRVNKRNIMVWLDFGTAALVLGFYLLQGKVPLVPLMIVCLMLLYGISGTYSPAVQASIPALLPSGQVMRGNAVINMVSTLSGLLGPVIGGVLFGTWGIVPILILSSACFACSAVMELFIRIPTTAQPRTAGVWATVGADLRESWRYIKTEKPVFLQVVLVLALFNLLLSAVLIVGLPVLVVNFLGMSDAALGFTQGAMGLGGLAGGILAGVLGGKLRLRCGHWVLAACSLMAGVMGLAVLPGVPARWGYGLVTLMSFAAMAVSTVFVVLLSSVVQQQTPPHLLGKIMALILAIANCASPLGQALYGALFQALAAAPWAVLLGAGGCALLVSLYSKNVFLRLEQEQGRE